MNLNKGNIIVTGGAGYIGSHTVVSLIEKGYKPIIIDDFRNAQKDVILRLEKITKESIIYYPIACQNKEELREVFQKHKINGIIHFAADKAVGESVQNPLKYFDNNFGSLVSLLQVAEEFQIQHFIFSSSCTVYGSPENIPVVEESKVSYNSPYGYTKKVCEEMLIQYVESRPNFKATLLRYFNPIGAHESGLIGEEPDGIPNNLLPFITQTALGIRKELIVFGEDYGTPDGTCIRDYIHVVDLAEAHVVALENSGKTKENPAIYNVGTGKGTSVLEMIRIFDEISGLKLSYKVGARRAGDIPQIFANTHKINNVLKWKAKRTIKEAIASAWKFEQNIRKIRN
ncbi:MAG: UDP-glucose 4-epimerase GalE [Brumimicrobium sp.]